MSKIVFHEIFTFDNNNKINNNISTESTHTLSMKKFTFILLLPLILLSVIVAAGAAAPQQSETRELPILMYHSVLKSKNGTYIVSPKQMEEDFKRIISEGYTTVTTQQVIDFVDGKGSLPAKPILITFDDGHYNNIYYAKPLLERYNLKAILNVIGKFSDYSTSSGDIDNPNYSHVTWAEVAELSNSNVMEVGNHTYNMHNFKPRFGMSQKYGETEEQYVTAIRNDIGQLQKILFENTGKQCRVLAYPFGKYSVLAEETLIKMGFRMMFTCNEGVSVITRGKPQSLYKLKRINRSGLYDTDTVFKKVNQR